MPDTPAAVVLPLTGGIVNTSLSIWLFKDVKNSKYAQNGSAVASMYLMISPLNAC